MDEIVLSSIKVDELLQKFSVLIDDKLSKVLVKLINQGQSDFLTRKETAELLKITLPTLHEWTKLGWLKASKIGRRVLYKRHEVEEALPRVTFFKHKKIIDYEA